MRWTLVAVVAVVASPAQGRWTFCVAEAGQDIWITEVFPVAHKRERLEAAFGALLRVRGVNHAVAQCPAPLNDKADVFNAQFTAAEFHRKLGQTLHAVEMPPNKR